MAKYSWITLTIFIFVFVWCALLLSVFLPDSTSSVGKDSKIVNVVKDEKFEVEGGRVEIENNIIEPKRYKIDELRYDPPPLEEIRRNMTLYLHTLHSTLGAMAGPTVDAESVWEVVLSVLLD